MNSWPALLAIEEIVWYNPSSTQLEEFEAVSCVSGNTTQAFSLHSLLVSNFIPETPVAILLLVLLT